MPVVNSSAITGIAIVTYLAENGERAKAFYRDTLGLSVTTDYGPNGAEFELADGATFGVWQMDDGTFRPTRGIMFAVGDLKAAVEHYRDRGVVFEDNGAIQENPGCYMAFANDSEGNTFILHQHK